MPITGVSIPELQKHYPGKGVTGVEVATDVLGADHWLTKDPNLNTCTIRLSKAFNYGGAPMKPMAGVAAEKGLDKKLYVYKVEHFVNYTKAQFGKPDVIKAADNAADLTAAINGKPGVLFFRLQKENSKGNMIKQSLYGHADIWDGSAIWYNDVLFKTWEITLWRV